MTLFSSSFLILATTVSSYRIGQHAFVMPSGYSAPNLEVDDLSLVGETNRILTSKSGAVVYSTLDGFCERFLSQYADAGETSLKDVDVLGLPYGNSDSRDFDSKTHRPALFLDPDAYSGMMNHLKNSFVQQDLQQYVYSRSNETFTARYSPAEFAWCHPRATPIQDVDWTGASDFVPFVEGTWGAVNEIRHNSTVPELRYGFSLPNAWLCWANQRNGGIRPMEESSQSSGADALCGFGFADYLAYVDEVFGVGRVEPTTNITREIARTFHNDWRFSLPIFSKTLSALNVQPVVISNVDTLNNSRELFAEKRNFTIYPTDEIPPQFEREDAVLNATNYIDRVICTNYDGIISLALSNGSGGPYAISTFDGDVVMKLYDPAGTLTNFQCNAWMWEVCSDPWWEDSDGCINLHPVNASSHGNKYSYVKLTEEPFAFELTKFEYTNTYARMYAGVTRSCKVSYPATFSNMTAATFPSLAAARAGAPECSLQYMQIAHNIKFVPDLMEGDPTYPGKSFEDCMPFEATGDMSRYATSAFRSGGRRVQPTALSNQVNEVNNVLEEGFLKLSLDFSQDRGGLDVESLIPLNGQPENIVFNTANALFYPYTTQIVGPTYILLLKEDNKINAVAHCTFDDNVEDVAYPLYKDGSFLACKVNGGTYVPIDDLPEFWLEDEPRWWRGCIYSRFGLWCDWTWYNYRFIDDE